MGLGTMIYRYCTQTDPGLLRKNNEDSVAFDEATGLAVLADGMGGYNAGEVASEMATAGIKVEMVRWLTAAGPQNQPAALRQAIETCVERVNRSIFKAAQSQAHYAGMGTTLVLGVFRGTQLLLGHVGDSRCYRLRQGHWVQLTRDHSYVQEQLDAGRLTPAQAATSMNKHLVTRALGIKGAAQLELHAYEVEPDDLYLMCSDGLSDMVSDADMASILAASTSLAQRAQRLVQAANQGGGRDNITVLLVQAETSFSPRSGVRNA